MRRRVRSLLPDFAAGAVSDTAGTGTEKVVAPPSTRPERTERNPAAERVRTPSEPVHTNASLTPTPTPSSEPHSPEQNTASLTTQTTAHPVPGAGKCSVYASSFFL